MFFMVGVGLNAGGGIVDALARVGPLLFVCGAILTIAPVVLGYFFGRMVLKMNPAILLGGLTGAMTSTPALGNQRSPRSSSGIQASTGGYRRSQATRWKPASTGAVRSQRSGSPDSPSSQLPSGLKSKAPVPVVARTRNGGPGRGGTA